MGAVVHAKTAPVLVASGLGDILPMDRSGDPRNHISVCVNDLCIRLGHVEPRDEHVSAGIQTYWELGNSFEEGVVLNLIKLGRMSRVMQTDVDRYIRPGVIEKEGMLGNPDLFDLLEFAVIEVKLTKISSKHEPTSEKFWKYWTQAKAYAFMMDWTRVYLHIGHINGDYKGIEPHYNIWRWDFTQQELRDNWEMLRRHSGRLMNKAG